jgi:hypothetical protein
MLMMKTEGDGEREIVTGKWKAQQNRDQSAEGETK